MSPPALALLRTFRPAHIYLVLTHEDLRLLQERRITAY